MPDQHNIEDIRHSRSFRLLFQLLVACGVSFVVYCLVIGRYPENRWIPTTAKFITDNKAPGERSDEEKHHYAAMGKLLFAEYCVVCHGANARGLIGPDLSRKDFTYGKSVEALTETITKGRPGGMPAFGNQLGQEQIRQLVQFILSL